MKSLLVIIAVFLSSSVVAEGTKAESKILDPQEGGVLIKGEQKIGTAMNVSLNVYEIFYPQLKETEYGITIYYRNTKSMVKYSENIGYEKLENLIKGLDYIVTVNADATSLSSFIASYTLPSSGLTVLVSSGRKGAIHSSVIVEGITVDMRDKKNLTTLKELVIKAKAKIDSLKEKA
jgi:hypothetical protein